MRNISYYIHKIKTTPFPSLVKRVAEKGSEAVAATGMKMRDRILDTRSSKTPGGNLNALRIDVASLDLSGIDRGAAREMLRMWKAHRFDLLGSGWVRVGFYDNAPGFLGCRYKALELEGDANGAFLDCLLPARCTNSSKKIWKNISPGYRPIDWQKDFKSGYRWDAKTWYRPQRTAHLPGGEIKVPWELARLQHLPRMALFSLLFPEEAGGIRQEFCDECMDFIAQNPPRMGVNWVCTMDVGIRLANIALAYSLFVSGGAEFSESFERILLASVYEHCRHIRRNLEWSSLYTSNHYFADISGLLFGAAVLPECSKRARWISFAAQQIKVEINKQFYPEGSNKEGSVAYHRLTSEMAVYSTALLASLSEDGFCPPINSDFSGVIYRSGLFLQALTRPDGMFTQFGDNDSGFFFRLSPTGILTSPEDARKTYATLEGYVSESCGEDYMDENVNDPKPFISALSGLFSGGNFSCEAAEYPLECSIVRTLCRRKALRADCCEPESLRLSLFSEKLPYESAQEFSSAFDLTDGLELKCFPYFGAFIFRSKNLYLAICASDNGQNGAAGHAHNDKLSFELFIDGTLVMEDPGTFVYTSSPEMRDLYRSTRAHNAVFAGKEQNEFLTAFSMRDETRCSVICLSDFMICLSVEYYGIICRRDFIIEKNRLIVKDSCTVAFQTNVSRIRPARGYGKVLS